MFRRSGTRTQDDRASSAGLIALALICLAVCLLLLVGPGDRGPRSYVSGGVMGALFLVCLVNGVRPKRWSRRGSHRRHREPGRAEH